MARAKRTDRAEARRRHRAELAAAAAEPLDEEEAPEPSPAPARRGLGQRPAGPRPQRPSMLRAFRDAYQPADVRGDVRALPELIRSRAVWLPALLVIISTIAYMAAASAALSAGGFASPTPSPSATAAASAAASAAVSPSPSGSSAVDGSVASGSLLGTAASILALLFLQTPPIGGIYLAAILAKRASYIAGMIAGLLGAIGFTVYVVTLSLPPDLVPANFNDLKIQVIEQSLLSSTLFGLFIGAGLGYYRRLLRLMNPTPDRPSRPRPAARRR